jgi:hypothetical protein
MPVTIDGVSATDDPLAADLVVQMDRQVANEDVDNTQFTTMMMKLPSSTAKSFKQEWLEDVYIPKYTALAATAATADTVLTVTTNEGTYAKVGDIAKIVQTGEAVRIVTVGASAWTVVRAIGSVAAATAATGAPGIVIVSGSNEQGSTSPTAQVTEKTSNYNYCGILRNNYEYTSTAEWTEWYSGDPIAYQRKKVAVEHKREIEQTLFWGARSYTAGTTHPRGTTGGLDQFISTNITDAAGTFDKGELNDFLRSGLEYGERTRKVLFAAPIVAQVISEFLADNWVRARPDDSVWGVRADAIIDAVHGARIPVFVKNDWKRFGEGTGLHLGSRAYLVDMTKVEILRAPATRKGPRFAALWSKQEANDKDSLSETFLSEFTFIVKNEKAHAMLKGVTG